MTKRELEQYLTAEQLDNSNLSKKIKEIIYNAENHFGEFILVIEKRYNQGSKGGCVIEYPGMERSVQLGILAGTGLVQKDFLWMIFKVQKLASREHHRAPELLSADEITIGGGRLLLAYISSTSEHNKLEVIVGDEAIESWYAENKEYKHEFRGLCELIERPNKIMKKEAEDKKENEKKDILEKLSSYPDRIRADVNRAKELGLGDNRIVSAWDNFVDP